MAVFLCSKQKSFNSPPSHLHTTIYTVPTFISTSHHQSRRMLTSSGTTNEQTWPFSTLETKINHLGILFLNNKQKIFILQHFQDHFDKKAVLIKHLTDQKKELLQEASQLIQLHTQCEFLLFIYIYVYVSSFNNYKLKANILNFKRTPTRYINYITVIKSVLNMFKISSKQADMKICTCQSHLPIYMSLLCVVFFSFIHIISSNIGFLLLVLCYQQHTFFEKAKEKLTKMTTRQNSLLSQ